MFCVLCGLFSHGRKVPFSPSSYCCYLFAALRSKAFAYFSGPSRAMSKEGVLLLLPDRNTDPVLPSRANVREQRREREREREREKESKKIYKTKEKLIIFTIKLVLEESRYHARARFLSFFMVFESS